MDLNALAAAVGVGLAAAGSAAIALWPAVKRIRAAFDASAPQGGVPAALTQSQPQLLPPQQLLLPATMPPGQVQQPQVQALPSFISEHRIEEMLRRLEGLEERERESHGVLHEIIGRLKK